MTDRQMVLLLLLSLNLFQGFKIHELNKETKSFSELTVAISHFTVRKSLLKVTFPFHFVFMKLGIHPACRRVPFLM